jgi:hypothetical protein
MPSIEKCRFVYRGYSIFSGNNFSLAGNLAWINSGTLMERNGTLQY